MRNRVEVARTISQTGGPDLELDISEVEHFDQLSSAFSDDTAKGPEAIHVAAAAIAGVHFIESDLPTSKHMAENLHLADQMIASSDAQPVVGYSSNGAMIGTSSPNNPLVFHRRSLWDVSDIEIACTATSTYHAYQGQQIAMKQRTSDPSKISLGLFGNLIVDGETDINTRAFFNEAFIAVGKPGVNRLAKALVDYEFAEDHFSDGTYQSHHSNALMILGELKDQGWTIGTSRTAKVRNLGKQTASKLIAGTANLNDFANSVYIAKMEKATSGAQRVADRLRGVTFYSTDHREITEKVLEQSSGTQQGAFMQIMAAKTGSSIEEYAGAHTKDFMQHVLGISM